jgi:hypothetical protein
MSSSSLLPDWQRKNKSLRRQSSELVPSLLGRAANRKGAATLPQTFEIAQTHGEKKGHHKQQQTEIFQSG